MKKLSIIFFCIILCSSAFGQYDWIVGEWEANVQGQTVTANFNSDGGLTMKFGAGQPMTETYKVTSNTAIALSSGNLSYEISEDRNTLDLNFGGDILSLTRQESTASAAPKAKTSGSKNWDKILADYEAYTDQYIKLLKKYNDGDMSVMTEYMEMMEKATALQISLAEADDDLTTAQLQRYMKITQKMLDAAADLYGDMEF